METLPPTKGKAQRHTPEPLLFPFLRAAVPILRVLFLFSPVRKETLVFLEPTLPPLPHPAPRFYSSWHLRFLKKF